MKRALLLFAASLAISFSSMADICIPTDPDFDPIDCALNSGTIGTAVGITGAPGAPATPAASGVPVDGGASILALAGMAYARKRMQKKA